MIGDNIYEIRKKRGYTLTELAERALISKSYLSNIERNINKNPSIKLIKKLALVLDVDLKTLLGAELEEKERLDTELVDFVKELKDSGIEKEEIRDYKKLLEFIKWQSQNSEKDS